MSIESLQRQRFHTVCGCQQKTGGTSSISGSSVGALPQTWGSVIFNLEWTMWVLPSHMHHVVKVKMGLTTVCNTSESKPSTNIMTIYKSISHSPPMTLSHKLKNTNLSRSHPQRGRQTTRRSLRTKLRPRRSCIESQLTPSHLAGLRNAKLWWTTAEQCRNIMYNVQYVKLEDIAELHLVLCEICLSVDMSWVLTSLKHTLRKWIAVLWTVLEMLVRKLWEVWWSSAQAWAPVLAHGS